MPLRLLGTDEAIYVLQGSVNLRGDGEARVAGAGAFSYACAGTVLQWQASQDSRLLVFHFPGGFDHALACSQGDDAFVVAWLEGRDTRFLEALPLDAVDLETAPLDGGVSTRR